MRLEGKVIIVTGSTTGIGKAIAIRCAQEGAKVVINGRNAEAGEKVVQTVGNTNAVLHVDDLNNAESSRRLVKKALKAFGRLDGIVNNAAMVVASNIQSTDANFLHRVFTVNTVAPFMLIKTALPHLSKVGGSVLNIGSVNAYSGEPDLLAYSISKGALMTLTRNLGDTLMREHGVRVNQINPGWVLTENEIIKKRKDGLAEDWYKKVPRAYAPSGRILRPEEIAAAAIFWLGEECGPVSGQVFELEQYPFIGRNPPKDASTIPVSK